MKFDTFSSLKSGEEILMRTQAAQAQGLLNYNSLNYKDLYGNVTDLCKMAEVNIILSIKSTFPSASYSLSFTSFSSRFESISAN